MYRITLDVAPQPALGDFAPLLIILLLAVIAIAAVVIGLRFFRRGKNG